MKINFQVSDLLAKLYFSWFGIGYCPVAPGTAGSAAALPFTYLLLTICSPYVVILISLLLVLPGYFFTTTLSSENHDPSWIVIDEVAGQMLTIGLVAIILTPNLYLYLLSFICFRCFDIFKPWPISIIDQEMKTMSGVMLDDLIAGIYAAITVIIIITVSKMTF